MTNLSLGTTQDCGRVLNTLYKKLFGSIKVFLMLFLFAGTFVQNTNAQTCNGMVTPGFTSCAGEVIVYTSTVDQSANVHWTISPNTSGAFFTANGLTTIASTVSPGPNTMSVNVGPNAGSFTITLTFDGAVPADLGSCSASRTVKKVTATSSHTNVNCFGGNNGTMTAVASGGTPPYSYVIAGPTVNTTGAATGVFTGLTAGTYTITVTDATNNGGGGCSVTTTQTITQPASALTATSSHTNVSCFGGNNGTVTAVGAGGTPPYSYVIAGPTVNTTGAATGIFTGLTAGTYTVTVTDANGCTTTTSQTVTQPNQLTATSSHTNVSCFGGNNGTVTAVASGGTPAYSYVIAGPTVNTTGAATGIFTGLTAGTYTVTVTDSKGCTTTTSQTITQPTQLTATSSHTNVTCFGGNNGSVTAVGAGGTPPYSYVIAGPTVNTTGAATGIFTGLTAGTYTVTVTDGNNCTTTTTQTITQPTQLTATSSHTNVSCFGGTNGTVTAVGAGGTPPYSYVIAGPTVNTTGAATGVFTGLTAGTYTVTVTDASGCTTTTSQTVTQPTQLTATSSHTNVSCFGGTNGTVTAVGAGGTPPYSYVIAGPTVNTTGAATGVFTGLTAGTYTVTVTDANGCTTTTAQTVTQPTQLTATSSHTNVTCFGGNNGSVTAVGAGGTPPYSYVIAGPTVNTTGAATGIFTGLTAGTYTVTVTDFNGCTTTTSQTITQPTQLTATSSHTNVTCFGGNNGSVTAVGAGGTPPYSYVIAGPTVNTTGAATGIFTGLTAGTYTVTVTDGNNCTTTTTQTITQPTQLTATSSHTNVSCFGGTNGTVTAVGAGGTPPYSYVIAGPTVNTTGAATGIFTGLSAGTYTVTVTDASGCTTTTSQTVTQPTQLTATSSHTNVSCFGGTNGTVTAVGAGGTPPYSYVIAGPTVNTTGAATGVFTGLTAGTYTVTVTDSKGCTTTTSQTVTQPTQLTATSSHTNVTCFGGNNGSVTAVGAGGTPPYSYVIAGPTVNTTGAATGVFTGLTTGTYTVTVTDANGCTTTTSQTVTSPTQLTATSSHTNVTCFGGTNGTVTAVGAGGTPPYSYVIAGPTVNTTGAATGVFTGLSAGTYTVTVTDGGGCTTTTTQVVTQPTQLTATSSHVNVSCFGGNNGTVTAVGAGGTPPYSYVIAGPTVNTTGAATGVFTGLTAGTYTVTVTDASGCTTTTSQTITQPTQLTATSSHTNVSCFGGNNGTVTAVGAGGTPPYSYVIAGPTVNTTGAATGVFTGLTAGTYTVTVTDSKGCTTTTSQTITQPTQLTATSSHTNVSCFGGNNGTVTAVGAGGTPPYSYVIAGPTVNTTGAATGVFTGLTAGTYTVTVTDAGGCTTTTSQTVTQPTQLTATSSHTNITCFGSTDGTVTAVGAGGTPPYSYVIAGPTVNTTGAATGVFTGLSAGTYTVTVTDANGCTTTTSQTVTQPTAISLSLTQVNAPCANANGGTVTATFSGGTGAYQARIDGGVYAAATSPKTFTGLAAGSHTVDVKDANGCVKSATITVGADVCHFYGCSPGFWKNHESLWTNATLQANEGTHKFNTNTNFQTYFNLTNAQMAAIGISTSATMHDVIAQGGGGCVAFARHAISALLTAGSGLTIDWPTGIAHNFDALYTAIRNTFISGNCNTTFANQVIDIANDDESRCGQFAVLLRTAEQQDAVIGKAPQNGVANALQNITVGSFPNPYNDNVKFTIESTVSGKGVLEVFNMFGQKIQTVFEGPVEAGKSQTIQYNVPVQHRTNLMYRLKVGDNVVTGKLLGSK